jgi:copper chaperone NosL
MRNKISIGLIFIVLLCAGCSSSQPEAVPIQPEDMCSYCRMAITSKHFAAELITSDEKVFKFDDIGCMLNFVDTKTAGKQITALYVADFNSQQWIPAEQAHYVSTDKVQTPMNGNFLAFENPKDASEAASKYEGRLLNFADLKKQKRS